MKTVKLIVGIVEIAALYYLSTMMSAFWMGALFSESVKSYLAPIIPAVMVAVAILIIATRHNRGDGSNYAIMLISGLNFILSALLKRNTQNESALPLAYMIVNCFNTFVGLFGILYNWNKSGKAN